MPTFETAAADQAAGLRHLARPVRVIAVASGKGGVGKTNASVNLSVALSQLGRNVMLFDADLGLANVDVLLGLTPQADISAVIEGRLGLSEILLEGPGGIKIVPASSGVSRMVQLSPAEHAGIIRAFSELHLPVDVLIVDTAAGLANNVTSFTRAAQDVIVVVCDEPASITDAYALIKVMYREHQTMRFHILANMVRTAQEGVALYRKLATVCERFLDVALHYVGAVPFDDYLRKSVQRQMAVVDGYPSCRASAAFKSVARKIDAWPMPQGASGHLEFFVERMIGAEQSKPEFAPFAE